MKEPRGRPVRKRLVHVGSRSIHPPPKLSTARQLEYRLRPVPSASVWASHIGMVRLFSPVAGRSRALPLKVRTPAETRQPTPTRMQEFPLLSTCLSPTPDYFGRSSLALRRQNLHRDSGGSSPYEIEAAGGEPCDADLPALHERSSIIDTHDDTPVVTEVSHLDLGSKRQRAVCRRQSITVEALPTCCAAAIVSSRIERCGYAFRIVSCLCAKLRYRPEECVYANDKRRQQ